MDQTRDMQALANVRQVITSRGFPLMTQRKCNGILNAMAMQTEDGEYSIEVVEHLGNALLAFARDFFQSAKCSRKASSWRVRIVLSTSSGVTRFRSGSESDWC
jgi:hypothetical protein